MQEAITMNARCHSMHVPWHASAVGLMLMRQYANLHATVTGLE